MLNSPRYESDVGNDLRAAREQRGWSLEDIGASLRIKPQYLQAIEDGRVHDLPANVYAVGFLRAYAAILHLDPDNITKRYRAETRDVARKPALEFPAPVPERGVPAGALVLLGAVIAIGACVGWYRMSGDRQNTAVVQQVPERLAPLAETRPTPATPPAAAPAAVVDAPPPGPAVSPGSAAAAARPPSITTAGGAAPLAGAADASRITLRARQDTWVQIRDPKGGSGGGVVFNRVLRPGETWSVPSKPPLLLTTGNAGGLDLLVDGTVAPPLTLPSVRRDMPLDADQIRDGKLPAQQASAAKPSTATSSSTQ